LDEEAIDRLFETLQEWNVERDRLQGPPRKKAEMPIDGKSPSR
jgi:hypothetical protein